jgi:hypothetical protein
VSSFLKKLLGLNIKVKQRFFPQCNGCSSVRPARAVVACWPALTATAPISCNRTRCAVA